jgi:hypothetical protein
VLIDDAGLTRCHEHMVRDDLAGERLEAAPRCLHAGDQAPEVPRRPGIARSARAAGRSRFALIVPLVTGDFFMATDTRVRIGEMDARKSGWGFGA